MPDVFGQLKEAYQDMGMKFTGGDKGPSSLTWPELMEESANIVNQRRKKIAEYNRKVVAFEAASGVLTGSAGSSYNIEPRGDSHLDRLGRVILGGVRQGASNAGYAVRDMANQWRNRAYQELQQELSADQDMENFYRQKLQIVGQTNINERERLAADMFSDTEKAARLYKTLSLHDGEAVSLERFKSVFGMPGMKINETVWTDIQGRGFAIAQKELSDMTLGQAVSNGRTIEKQQKKNAKNNHHDDDEPEDKPKPKESVASKNTGNASSAKTNDGPVSDYVAALRETSGDPLLVGSTAEARRGVLLDAIRDVMLNDKQAYFLQFKSRKDLGYAEFMAQPGMQDFKDLFGDNPKKAEKAFEAFEKEIDVQAKKSLETRGVETGGYKISQLSRSQKREIDAALQDTSLAALSPATTTQDIDLAGVPKLRGQRQIS